MPFSPRFLAARTLTALAMVVPCITSCSAAPSSDAPASSATDEALTGTATTCPASATYGVIVFVSPGVTPACPSVAGTHGTWVNAVDLPPLACAATRDPARGVPVLCNYEWTPSPSHPGAAPDAGALESLPDVYLAPFGDGGENACADVSSLPHAALLDEAGVTCPPRHGPPDGPAACTVCGVPMYPGVVGRGHLWLSASSSLRTVVVGLSNGTQRILTFDTPAQTATHTAHGSQHVVVPLPPLPRRLRYVDGPVLGYGYGHQHP
jgi:hypothetical protein